MFLWQLSNPVLTIDNDSHNEIHLFLQFFVHRDVTRQKEFLFCLHQHIQNPAVSKIHLLGERIYTDNELGIQDKNVEKIIQTVIGRRLQFQDIFVYIRQNSIPGYHVLLNSDICFESSALDNLRKSDMPYKKKMMALLRYEYNPLDPSKSQIYGPSSDSQDTWILHSKFPVPEFAEKTFKFEFGKPGCDNKLVYLFSILGYEVVNDPLFIKTFHVHASEQRDYTIKDRVPRPYMLSFPANMNPRADQILNNYYQITRGYQDMKFDDNDVLRKYILDNTRFVVPHITGIFQKDCKMCICGNNNDSYQELSSQWQNNPQIRIFSENVLEIFHSIFAKPWTQALLGKRILWISSTEPQLVRKQWGNRQSIYNNVDLFPECEIVVLHNNHGNPIILDSVQDKYDVALVSGPNSNHLCKTIYEKGKSAIYVGDILPMYLGILDKRWFNERPDVIRMYLNQNWSR